MLLTSKDSPYSNSICCSILIVLSDFQIPVYKPSLKLWVDLIVTKEEVSLVLQKSSEDVLVSNQLHRLENENDVADAQ